MKEIIDLVSKDKALKALENKKTILINGIWEEALLIASLYHKQIENNINKDIVILKENAYQTEILMQYLNDLDVNVLSYVYDESLRVEVLASSKEMIINRLQTIDSLLNDNSSKVLILHPLSATRKIVNKTFLQSNYLNLTVEQQLSMEDLKRYLSHVGYQYLTTVDQKTFFSYRGGIIDLFAINHEYPIRIEFFGDFIDSIRYYDPYTQRTIEKLNNISLAPANDVLFSNQDKKNITDYLEHYLINQDTLEYVEMQIDFINDNNYDSNLAKYLPLTNYSTIWDYVSDDAFVIASNYNDIKQNYELLLNESYDYQTESSRGIDLESLYIDLRDILSKIDSKLEKYSTGNNVTIFNTMQPELMYQKTDVIVNTLKDYQNKYKTLLVLSDISFKPFQEFLKENELSYRLINNTTRLHKGLNVINGNLNQGIVLKDQEIAIITGNELFHTMNTPKRKYKLKNSKQVGHLEELSIGDFVVHEQYGVGQYLGIETLTVLEIKKDYMKIAYKDDDVLYIPVEQFAIVRKYVGKEGFRPKVNGLHSKSWQKTKNKVQDKVNDLAEKLIALYASRIEKPGYAFSEDTLLQADFENSFQYELTPDQQTVTNEIKKEMEKPLPMDYLLCGDVGFGKTEVALRAAFKAIVEQKQVAFLCPTTILSKQHFDTMTNRFKDYGINFALVNRFTTSKSMTEIKKQLLEGKLDMVVGTHRLLNKELVFKDLGLLIIDEEQRFGVAQKEKIKEMTQLIDVLTLTATPIPRTLHMSLMGVRSLGQILTPPKNRLPIQTYVMAKDWNVIKEVIQRELSRQGQVFFVHNNINELTSIATMITNLVPNAKVTTGHGQMDKVALEDTMLDFIDKKFNVLVCTTIIETGIDVSNANTIIIDHAQDFGLAQLYQIRGRVGRSERLAYAYLLYPQNKQLSEIADKRLKAIKEHVELGSGYKIANQDLMLRGAGDLLGKEQAGFMNSIGYDMYMKLLEDAINIKRGDKQEEIKAINVQMDYYIPENYVNNDLEKLQLHQQIQNIQNLNVLELTIQQLTDQYGKLPTEMNLLIEKRRFDLLANELIIDNIDDTPNLITITLSESINAKINGVWLFKTIDKNMNLRFINNKIILSVKKEKGFMLSLNNLLNKIKTQISTGGDENEN